MTLKRFIPSVFTIVLPVVFALTLPFFFRLRLFTDPLQLVSILAMIGLPFSEGMLVMLASSTNNVSKAAYRVFMPWLPVMIFFLFTFMTGLEDCACWLIGLPVYLLFSSLGGLTGGFFKRKRTENIEGAMP